MSAEAVPTAVPPDPVARWKRALDVAGLHQESLRTPMPSGIGELNLRHVVTHLMDRIESLEMQVDSLRAQLSERKRAGR